MMKQSVSLLGEGAKVKIKRTDGVTLKGVIDRIDDQGFVLTAQGNQPETTVAYNQIAELKPAKRSYKASGQPDPREARRAVVGLGVGRHVMVKLASEQELHGHIQAIGMDHFTLLPDREKTPLEIAYSQVRVVHKNLSAGATLAIILGIAAAAAIAAVIVTDSDTVRGSL
jgi:small nuclear ribonucleoprotein (snRNP)-like protein